MGKHYFNEKQYDKFNNILIDEEKSGGTIEIYLRNIRAFARWLNGSQITKQSAAGWKDYLIKNGYAPSTINGMLTALNRFFNAMGWRKFSVKFIRLQRKLFRKADKELSRAEYERLVQTAQRENKPRLALILETICSTGIRVRELKYITVEAAYAGEAEISLKGKVRVIFMPKKLCKKLIQYAKKQKIVSGEIFLTSTGKSIGRKQIWAEMKALARLAGVPESKVFPHNLRHLFARIFYKSNLDVAKLADVLGHSSIETTRIYLISTGKEHIKALDRLRLVA